MPIYIDYLTIKQQIVFRNNKVLIMNPVDKQLSLNSYFIIDNFDLIMSYLSYIFFFFYIIINIIIILKYKNIKKKIKKKSLKMLLIIRVIYNLNKKIIKDYIKREKIKK
jgi:hypothetical protein